MRLRPLHARSAISLIGLVIACGARNIDVPRGSPQTDDGAAAGAGQGGSSPGGSGGSGGTSTGGGDPGSGGTTVGSGGITVGAGGSTVGAGGTTVGAGGSGGGTSTGGTGATGGTGGGGSGGTAGIDGGVGNCPCTRRPGPGASVRCPMGVGQWATADIGPSGGQLTIQGQQGTAQLTVAPTAFTTTISVQLTETALAPPSEFSDWSPIYDVTPNAVTTTSLVALRIPWSGRGGVVPQLTVYHAKDRNSPFLRLADANLNAGFVDCGTTAFGLFFVGALKSPAQASCP
jgi:hypothetical protein